MNLSRFLSGLPTGGRKAFAESIGVSPSFLYQISTGWRSAPHVLAIRIEEESGGAVSRAEVRPDVDWAYLGRPPVASGDAAQAKEGA
jgi:DNA-binding transcriptional regulator YdaS (Cro superfamily)